MFYFFSVLIPDKHFLLFFHSIDHILAFSFEFQSINPTQAYSSMCFNVLSKKRLLSSLGYWRVSTKSILHSLPQDIIQNQAFANLFRKVHFLCKYCLPFSPIQILKKCPCQIFILFHRKSFKTPLTIYGVRYIKL